MSTMGLRVDDAAWSGVLTDDGTPAHSRAERLLPVVSGACLVTADIALVVAAFLLAHWVRFIAPDDEAAALSLEQYARMGLIVSLLTALMFAFHGLYDEDHRIQPWPARLHITVSAVSTALILAVTISFFLGDQRFSRLWFAAGWAFAVAGLLLWRTLAQRLCTLARDALAPANRVLVVGANPLGEQLAVELAERYHVVGYVDNGSDLAGDGAVPLLGPIAQLERLVHAHAVDELVIALPVDRREQVTRLIARGFRRRVRVKFPPDLGELLPRRFELQHLGGRSYIGFAPVARVSWIKRVADLIMGSFILLALAPLLAAIAVAIRLESPGPIFYRQRRVGKDGRHFWMFKFRSMHRDADRIRDLLLQENEATGPLFKIRRDPRVTRVGRVLRRLSLDELPQLFNVIRGEMSLVGPRPPIPSEVEQYEDWQVGRLRAVPGMTGLWQVSGRSEVPFQDMVRLDLHYIRNWSLWLDLEILARTVPAVLTNRGAY
jgi:exopolysaccharide biosynthesis polyprenyl glycosylphosphotransferase